MDIGAILPATALVELFNPQVRSVVRRSCGRFVASGETRGQRCLPKCKQDATVTNAVKHLMSTLDAEKQEWETLTAVVPFLKSFFRLVSLSIYNPLLPRRTLNSRLWAS
jgi:hypothetical protein